MYRRLSPSFLIRTAIAAAFALTASLSSSTVVHAQDTALLPAPPAGVDSILLPASCTLDNPAQRGNLSTLTAQSGLIQNLGPGAVNLTCALVRTGGFPRVSVLVDVRPGSQPVVGRVVAADTSTGNSVGLQNAQLLSGPGGTGFQRVTAAFPMALSDNFGLTLRITLRPGDTLGRILVRQRPNPAFTQ